ncbi:uncharacterized protein LOC125681072 [Ostrea edulis]|uniref:uncharacterized protein LOC125681072 n=1 Tax=Ostrea edulis TaxID=37623 RepID=UPI002094E2F3|nr:uncharacterized protein LOC125681072 [Ostrea edulis]
MKGLYLFSLVLSGSLVSVTSFLNTGTSPSSPNTSLRSCMREAGYYKRSKSSYRNYRNKFSNSMKRWCLVHERVLPCVQTSIEDKALRSPSDWFLSMTFDSRLASRTSIAMCKKLKKLKRKLKCIKPSSLRRARRCVKSLTKPLRQTLTEMYIQNKTNGHDAQKLACIISAATATCYKEKIRSCRGYLRNYIGAYHVILGGKCLSVLQTSVDFADDSFIIPRQTDRNWISIVQSILKEVGINYFPTRTTSEIHSTEASSQETWKFTSAPPTKPMSDSIVDNQSTSYLGESARSESESTNKTESEENKHMQRTTTMIEFNLTTSIIRPNENSNNSESQEGSDVTDSDDAIYKNNVSTSFDKPLNYTPSTFSNKSDVDESSSTASPYLFMPSTSSKSLSCLSLFSLIVIALVFH